MLQNEILLSIIIPVYNGEKYLVACLESIYEESADIAFDFEVIIVDDGSTDKSSEICSNYCNLHANACYYKNPNHGVSYSRNYGMEKAQGKYVMFVDCDDLVDRQWHKCLEQCKKCDHDIVMISSYFINDYDEQISRQEVLSYILTYNDKGIRISGPYSKLFRRDFLVEKEIRFAEDIINGEDLLFNVTALLRSDTYLLIRDSYYMVRHNEFSSTSRFDERIIESEIRFNQELKSILVQSNFYNEKIEQYCFLISLRCLAIRMSYLNDYRKGRKIFQTIREFPFYSEGIRKYNKYDTLKNSILLYCYKYNLFPVLHCICRSKKKRIRQEHLEKL